MASARRRTDPPIDELLLQHGYRFSFFQAVRLLQRLFPQRRPIGTASRPEEEIVRVGVWLSMNFPASLIDQIEYDHARPEQQPRMTVTFIGLTGPHGALPLHYTERLLALKGNKDTVLAEFFGLFDHRLASLFYRAWSKHNPPAIYEGALLAQRHLTQPQPDFFSHSLFDLIGLGTGFLRGRMKVKDESLLLYAGLIAQRPHSASAVRAILRDYFAVAIEIEQLLGNWYEIEKADRSYLAPNLDRNRLGVGAFLGDKVWNQQDRFRVRVGPVSFGRFREFLPDRAALAKLVELVRFLVGQALAFDVQVLPNPGEIPDCRLTDQSPTAPLLGWTSWLKTKTFEFEKPPVDAVFTVGHVQV